MNIQEAIKKVELLGEYERFVDEPISKNSVLNILSQIDEPKKVVVPKFVAEWIEKCKDMNRSLRDAMKNTELSAELNAWFLKTGQDMFTYPNQETFARAWLDGYETKEKKYRIRMKNTFSYLLESENGWRMFNHKLTEPSSYTKSELEEAGFGGVFDNPMFEVVEVE